LVQFRLAVFAGLLLVGLSGAAGAQQIAGPLTQHNVSLQMALAMAHAAMAKCKQDGFDVSVAVVDRAGDLVALLRNDNANPHNAELARRKAYTARTFRQSSLDWENGLTAKPIQQAQRDLAQVIALGGGVPVMLGTEPIGAIGVSGSTTQDEDDLCAKAGVEAVLERQAGRHR
jgi:uncharacterized protein GlcG (DUF336 family)